MFTSSSQFFFKPSHAPSLSAVGHFHQNVLFELLKTVMNTQWKSNERDNHRRESRRSTTKAIFPIQLYTPNIKIELLNEITIFTSHILHCKCVIGAFDTTREYDEPHTRYQLIILIEGRMIDKNSWYVSII